MASRRKTETLVERADRYVRHSRYCRWMDGAYRDVPCTCGRDEFMEDLEELEALKEFLEDLAGQSRLASAGDD